MRNNPAMALEMLLPRHHPRFRFQMGGEERMAGTRAAAVESPSTRRRPSCAAERATTSRSTGSLMIDPDDGTLLRADLRIKVSAMTRESSDLDVTFGFEKALQMWVPVRMRERDRIGGGQTHTGEARRGLRQFVVQSRILPP